MSRAASSTWFAASERRPRAAVRLFCFAGAGGSGQMFRGWGEGIEGIEVLTAVLPGRSARFGEPPFLSMSTLVAAAADALRPLVDRPSMLLGHSLGALIAFELARVLRDGGSAPAHFFACGARPPHLPRSTSGYAEASDEKLIAHLRRLNGTPDELLHQPQMLELFLPAIRADMAVSQSFRFRAGEPLPCPISAYGGTDDEFITRSDLDGWRWHTSSRFALRMLPGKHFFLNDARDVLMNDVRGAAIEAVQ
jgi:medium-chain acyl-[acyl-carrier-protein] hydrolase